MPQFLQLQGVKMNKIGINHLHDLFNSPKNTVDNKRNEFLYNTILHFWTSARIIIPSNTAIPKEG